MYTVSHILKLRKVESGVGGNLSNRKLNSYYVNFKVKNLYRNLEWVQNHPRNFDKQSILFGKFYDKNISRLHNCQTMYIFLYK